MDVTVNKRAFVYPADRRKESAMRRRDSCSARPHADVMERHAAMRSDAVVAREDVDPPAVEKGRRRPYALADEDSWLHALEYARVQARSATLVAQLHDIALGEPKPHGIGRIDEHFRSLLSR